MYSYKRFIIQGLRSWLFIILLHFSLCFSLVVDEYVIAVLVPIEIQENLFRILVSSKSPTNICRGLIRFPVYDFVSQRLFARHWVAPYLTWRQGSITQRSKKNLVSDARLTFPYDDGVYCFVSTLMRSVHHVRSFW